jgi:hypothetical protein
MREEMLGAQCTGGAGDDVIKIMILQDSSYNSQKQTNNMFDHIIMVVNNIAVIIYIL